MIIIGINNVIRVAKAGFITVTVVLPAIEGGIVIAKKTSKAIKNKINNSEKINDIKKDFELRKEGIITVKYQEV